MIDTSYGKRTCRSISKRSGRGVFNIRIRYSPSTKSAYGFRPASRYTTSDNNTQIHHLRSESVKAILFFYSISKAHIKMQTSRPRHPLNRPCEERSSDRHQHSPWGDGAPITTNSWKFIKALPDAGLDGGKKKEQTFATLSPHTPLIFNPVLLYLGRPCRTKMRLLSGLAVTTHYHEINIA